MENSKTITLQATVTKKSDNSTVSNPTIKWESKNTEIATVNESSGEVTGSKAGEATITATYTDSEGKTLATATCEVTITATEPANVNDDNEPANGENEGGSGQATGNTQTVTWVSSNTSVATVSQAETTVTNGEATVTITAVAVGTATITATIKGTETSDTCEVTVTAASGGTSNSTPTGNTTNTTTNNTTTNETKEEAKSAADTKKELDTLLNTAGGDVKGEEATPLAVGGTEGNNSVSASDLSDLLSTLGKFEKREFALDLSTADLTQAASDNGGKLDLSLWPASVTNVNFKNNATVTNVDLSNNEAITEFNASGSGLKEITVAENKTIKNLNVGGTALTGKLDLTNCEKLESLDFKGCTVGEMDLSGCKSLKTIDFSGNAFTKFNFQDYASDLVSLKEATYSGQTATSSYQPSGNSVNIAEMLGETDASNVDLSGIKAFDAEGNSLTITGQTSTGVTFDGTPKTISYSYDTHFSSLLAADDYMSVSATLGDATETKSTTNSSGSGCNVAGFAFAGFMAAGAFLVTRKK